MHEKHQLQIRCFLLLLQNLALYLQVLLQNLFHEKPLLQHWKLVLHEGIF